LPFRVIARGYRIRVASIRCKASPIETQADCLGILSEIEFRAPRFSDFAERIHQHSREVEDGYPTSVRTEIAVTYDDVDVRTEQAVAENTFRNLGRIVERWFGVAI